MPKNIVTIGGGSGHAQLLSGLRTIGACDTYHITAVVSSADDGGPNGVLASEYNVAPPSDLRKCLLALARNEQQAQFWAHRFSDGPLNDYTVGNLALVAYAQQQGGMSAACAAAQDTLNTDGRVLPISEEQSVLIAVLQNGEQVIGETAVDMRREKIPAIDHVELQQPRALTSAAQGALEEADYIIFTMGDLFTSVIPCLLIEGVVKSIALSNAKTIMVCNRTTKLGETDGFTAADCITQLQRYLGDTPLHHAIMDSLATPVPKGSEAIQPVEVDGVQCIQADLADSSNLTHVEGIAAAKEVVRLCE